MTSKGVALVTGAGKFSTTNPCRGIGRAVALQLAEDGFDVAVNDLGTMSEELDTLVEEIQKKGRKSSSHIADISQEAPVKNMIEMVVQKHGSLDVMVANAGTGLDRPLGLEFIQLSVEDWDKTMAINARGTFLCYKYAGIQMIKQGRGGRIIGASSVLGKQAHRGSTTPSVVVAPQVAAYGASKFAVRGLTQAVGMIDHFLQEKKSTNNSKALEFAKYGITVNAYAPGAIDTLLCKYLTNSSSRVPIQRLNAVTGTDPAIGDAIRNHASSQSYLYIGITPLKTIGLPQDVANVVSFLVSEKSQFITGQAVGSFISLLTTLILLEQISVNGGLFFD
ncbi:acetoin reductase family protein [Mycena pura]|uniref:Acetoin reductase family protein n=1 Tax=Mycena pura TaxID=153505 RepID=A0AAD6UU91_9AGAR|nr:acetoin reductase family protein [Mycena pura]